ncbi:hypothetical protein [Streptomyces roseicoloratus]|uniref:Uncharacterized protein n=1 Tax=Streptomyces roseicoloratus TaxID=2508722 RepID=A0ABY9RTK7_9ACTN|nr:hypothetical protein [Streptomyces roseicoloratus]WMX45528.1 hypothetical protein RGF97_12615 [Streptomyces roseicoloratus]
MSDKPSGEPSDQGSDRASVSDAEWAAFVAAAKEQGLGTEAQERALREAKPKKQPKPPKATRATKRQEPAGWRTGPAWQEMNGRAQRRRRTRAVLGITAVAALALVAVRPQLVTGVLPESVTSALPSSWTDRPEDTTPLAAETALPTEPPEYAAPSRPTLQEPFKGSPALRWADGAAGIALPEPKPTGWMSKAQVETALKTSKEFLTASNLDPAVLMGGRPEAALRLIDPKQPGVREQLEKALAKPTEKNDPTFLFSRFDPSRLRLVGSVVKTRGHMTVTPGKGDRKGAVLVRADYTFVYPVVKTRPGADEVARTVVRREVTFAFYPPGRYDVTEGRLILDDYDTSAGNSACDSDDGFYHPMFPEDHTATSPADPAPTGPATDPYDRSKPLADRPSPECGTVTRS